MTPAAGIGDSIKGSRMGARKSMQARAPIAGTNLPHALGTGLLVARQIATPMSCHWIGGGGGGGGGGGTGGGGGVVAGGVPGGTGGGTGVAGGGVDGSPGGGTGGGCGMVVSGRTHADRSKNRNSSALACGDISFVLQPVGHGLPGSESSPPVVTPPTWIDFWM